MKKATSIVLSLALLLSLCTFPAAAANAGQEALDRWQSDKLIVGDETGNLQPDAPLTRAALATILNRLMGYQVKGANPFADLPDGTWYQDAILRLNAAGVMKGDGVNAKPDALVTRQEAAALAARALGVQESKSAAAFTDEAAIAGWAKGHVAALTERGCFAGESAFRPAEPMTRAETVVMLDTIVTAFVGQSGDYSKDAKGDVVVNAKNVTLKDMKIAGNLIIADGVDDGDVSLEKVTVAGNILLRGGGKNSVRLLPGTVVEGAIIITKTASGGIRLVNESGQILSMVNVADGKDGVTLEGKFGEIIVAANVPITLNDAAVTKVVSITAPRAQVEVTGKSEVAKLDVSKTAEGAKLEIGETAKVTQVNVAANGLIIDNANKTSKPAVKVDEAVTQKPTDPKGEEIKPNPPPSSGGGGSNEPPKPPAPTTVKAVTALLASPRAGKTATPAVPGGIAYTIATTWNPALVDGKFELGKVYTATLVFSLASASYAWGGSAPTVGVSNTSKYGGNAVLGAPVLNQTAGTVTITATYPAAAAVELEIKISGQPEESVTALEKNTSSKILYKFAAVTADGSFAPEYKVSYQWYQADNAEMTGNKTAVDEGANSFLRLPENLPLGTYYYACELTAEGVKESVMTRTVTVTVKPLEGMVTFSNLRLEATEWGEAILTWDTDQPNHAAYALECYAGEALLGRSTFSGIRDAALDTWLRQEIPGVTTITKVLVTPVNSDDRVSCGQTVSFDCAIQITNGVLEGEITTAYDPTIKELTVSGIPDGYTAFFLTIPGNHYYVGSLGFAEPTDGVCQIRIPDWGNIHNALIEEGAKTVLFATKAAVTDETNATATITIMKSAESPVVIL